MNVMIIITRGMVYEPSDTPKAEQIVGIVHNKITPPKKLIITIGAVQHDLRKNNSEPSTFS